jgi:hypothetical protein
MRSEFLGPLPGPAWSCDPGLGFVAMVVARARLSKLASDVAASRRRACRDNRVEGSL